MVMPLCQFLSLSVCFSISFPQFSSFLSLSSLLLSSLLLSFCHITFLSSAKTQFTARLMCLPDTIDSVSPQTSQLNLIPNAVALGGWAFGVIRSWGWCPHEWTRALMQKAPERALLPSTLWGYYEKSVLCQLGSGLLPVTKSASTLILDFLASRTMTNRWLLFNLPSLWYF